MDRMSLIREASSTDIKEDLGYTVGDMVTLENVKFTTTSKEYYDGIAESVARMVNVDDIELI